MTNHNQSLPKFAALAGLAAMTLSSCTLPPEQAWRKIRQDGLIAYCSYELGSQHADRHDAGQSPPQVSPTRSVPVATPAPVVAQSENQTQTAPGPAASSAPQIGAIGTAKALTAQTIPSLPGFVRSPYTNPPRLVDVKGAVPGATMVCPYTQRAFIIPTDYVNAPGPMVAGADSKVTKPKDKPVAENTKAQRTPEAPAPQPKVSNTEKPRELAKNSKSSTPSATSSSSSATPSAAQTFAPPALPTKPVQDIPFGSSIVGRPGFVNSPFAAKHQLVDVTGLPTGMEVKCPYTGKLFRVPPQDVATNKSTDTAAPLPPTPEVPKQN